MKQTENRDSKISMYITTVAVSSKQDRRKTKGK